MRITTALALGLAGILGLAGLGAPAAAAQTLSLKASVPHITTSGFAKKDVVPDEAVLSLGIMSESATAQAASADMAKTATAVIADAKGRGVEAKDIQTVSAELTTVYEDDYDQTGRRIKHVPRGFKASETFAIRLHDVTKAGVIAQALIDKGANVFNGITFEYSKQTDVERALQADAMRDALADAKSYTDAIGLKLGRVIQIGNDVGGEADLPSRRAPPTFVGKGKTVSTVAIPIEPGVQTISTSINVTWEIENEH